jgi:hypothetical protein
VVEDTLLEDNVDMLGRHDILRNEYRVQGCKICRSQLQIHYILHLIFSSIFSILDFNTTPLLDEVLVCRILFELTFVL